MGSARSQGLQQGPKRGAPFFGALPVHARPSRHFSLFIFSTAGPTFSYVQLIPLLATSYSNTGADSLCLAFLRRETPIRLAARSEPSLERSRRDGMESAGPSDSSISCVRHSRTRRNGESRILCRERFLQVEIHTRVLAATQHSHARVVLRRDQHCAILAIPRSSRAVCLCSDASGNVRSNDDCRAPGR